MLRKDIPLILRCPIDKARLKKAGNRLFCDSCRMRYPILEIDGKEIPDVRLLDHEGRIMIPFCLPSPTFDEVDIDNFGEATFAKSGKLHKGPDRKRYRSKLSNEILYWIHKIVEEKGKDILCLDLGTGQGGNKQYLYAQGLSKIVSLDYILSGRSKVLGDVHRLPFEDNTFDFIITTATLEHFYNPFIAFSEISRVLKKHGHLVATGSFWESWHAQSYFHFTPGGLLQLCHFSGLKVIDMWSGWGFIPAVTSHALGLSNYKRLFYLLQEIFDRVKIRKLGKKKAFVLKLKTSGSLGIAAYKE